MKEWEKIILIIKADCWEVAQSCWPECQKFCVLFVAVNTDLFCGFGQVISQPFIY